MKISYTRLKISIKILYKKQNVNYNFQKHLFMMLYVVEKQNIFNHTYYYKLNDKIASCNICKILDFFFKEYSNWT